MVGRASGRILIHTNPCVWVPLPFQLCKCLIGLGPTIWFDWKIDRFIHRGLPHWKPVIRCIPFADGFRHDFEFGSACVCYALGSFRAGLSVL